jgi:hypothetical protein
MSAVQRAEGRNLHVGSVDLAELEVVDAHVHRFDPVRFSQLNDKWNRAFVDALMPRGDLAGRPLMEGSTLQAVEQHVLALPRMTGLLDYLAGVYGGPVTVETLDAMAAEHINRDFTAYLRSILDRERIAAVVMDQTGLPDRTEQQTGDFPRDRLVWTFPLIFSLQPEWVFSRGVTTLGDAVAVIDRALERCVDNGCAGFKSTVAYYRPLTVQGVTAVQAESAFQLLRRTEPTGYRTFPIRIPIYADTRAAAALTTYQDYILKHMFVKAGELDRPIVIHTAVALHPALRPELNDPRGMYSMLVHRDIVVAGTQFLFIHTGYPSHHVMASMASQFPHVHVDLSFFSHFPGVLEETLRTLLAIVPPQKLMHGSDSGSVPEDLAYCAHNLRVVLARVLNDYRTSYGWSERDCAVAAGAVMSENARRLFKIRQ